MIDVLTYSASKLALAALESEIEALDKQAPDYAARLAKLQTKRAALQAQSLAARATFTTRPAPRPPVDAKRLRMLETQAAIESLEIAIAALDPSADPSTFPRGGYTAERSFLEGRLEGNRRELQHWSRP